MSSASFYKWRAKYCGMDASLICQMKAMEEENRRLTRMYADLSTQADLLKEALERSIRVAQRREMADLLGALTDARKNVGLWPLFPAPAQREGSSMEPQTGLPDLLRA